jgi:hypothetical protein
LRDKSTPFPLNLPHAFALAHPSVCPLCTPRREKKNHNDKTEICRNKTKP